MTAMARTVNRLQKLVLVHVIFGLLHHIVDRFFKAFPRLERVKQ